MDHHTFHLQLSFNVKCKYRNQITNGAVNIAYEHVLPFCDLELQPMSHDI